MKEESIIGALQFKSNQVQQDFFVDKLRETGNLSEAAKAAGIGRDTAYRLMKNDATFKEKVSEARLAYINQMSQTMRDHAPEAVEALLKVIRDENAPRTAQVAAATKIIDYSVNLTESLDYEQQISDLKQSIAEAEKAVNP